MLDFPFQIPEESSVPDRRNPEKQFRFICGTEVMQFAPELMPVDVNADFDNATVVRKPSALASKIIVLRTPEWELGLEEFGSPLPRNRVPRAAADEAIFAPACDVRKANCLEPLLTHCNLLVHDERHWYGALGTAESIVNWSECAGVVLTGDVRTIASNAGVIASASADDSLSIWAVTALPAVLDEDDKRYLEMLETHADLLINLSLCNERATTEFARYPGDESAGADWLYHQVVLNLIEAITVRGLICIDISDIRACLGGADRTYVGAGSGRGRNRGFQACEAAIAKSALGQGHTA